MLWALAGYVVIYHHIWNESMNDRLLDIQDLADRLKIPTKTIRHKLIKRTWPIRPVRIGRALRWRETDVATAIAGLSSGREISAAGRDR